MLVRDKKKPHCHDDVNFIVHQTFPLLLFVTSSDLTQSLWGAASRDFLANRLSI